MKRRTFIKGAAATTGAIAAGISIPEIGDGTSQAKPEIMYFRFTGPVMDPVTFKPVIGVMSRVGEGETYRYGSIDHEFMVDKGIHLHNTYDYNLWYAESDVQQVLLYVERA